MPSIVFSPIFLTTKTTLRIARSVGQAKLPSGEDAQAVADEELSAPVAEPSSAPSDAPKNIDVGAMLPSIVLKNEKGEDVDTASLTAEKGVVLFLVPKADTREYLGFDVPWAFW